MRVLVCSEPRKLKYDSQKEPVLSDNHALIKVNRIGVCGTDLHAFEGTQPYFTYPRILGHELSGTLVASDNAPGFKAGDLVSFIPYFNCGACVACNQGKPNCCKHLQVCGVHIDGGMSEYLLLPSSSLLHGNGLSLDELAMVEPMAIGAHGVRRANIIAGEFVLVVGAGPIGLCTMEFARLAGGNVIALDVNEQRLEFCRRNLGISHTIDTSKESAWEALQEITHGDMPSVVIDATGNLGAINAGFQFMAHGGRYVLIGLQRGDISLSHPEFHKREGTLLSSRNATREDFEWVIEAIKMKRVNPTSYITHRVHFDDVASQFETWLDPKNGVIKAMISI